MNVSLNKQTFDKDKFKSTVNTNFTQLVQPPPQTFFDINLATVEDFFTLYQKFFYDIPKSGSFNSHLVLVETSGDYINFEKDETDLQELLNEINSLRKDNLDLQQQLVASLKP